MGPEFPIILMYSGRMDEPPALAFYFTIDGGLGLPEGWPIFKGEPQVMSTSDREFEIRVNRIAFRFFERKVPASATDTGDAAFRVAADLLELATEADEVLQESLPPATVTVVEAAAEVTELHEVLDSAKGHVDDPVSWLFTPVFDYLLAELQKALRAYEATFGEVAKLPTLQNLPLAIPMAIPSSIDSLHQGRSDSGVSVFLTTFSKLRQAEIELPVEELAGRFNAGLMLFENNGPFAPYLEIRQEAIYNLRIEGQARAGMIALGSSCELLLDDLLLCMLWETEMPPERAADEGFKRKRGNALAPTSVVYRVKNSYSKLLGKAWRFDKSGPLWEWNENVAKIRNRVVHGGYAPTHVEVAGALRAESRLNEFVADLLAEEVERYPITALSYLGADGLQRRGVSVPNSLVGSLNVNQKRFARFRRLVSELRKPDSDRARPSVGNSDVVIVVRDSSTYDTFLVDPEAAMAAKMNWREQVPSRLRREIHEIVMSRSLLSSPEYVGKSISLPVNPRSISKVPEWKLSYKLIPGHEVAPLEVDPR